MRSLLLPVYVRSATFVRSISLLTGLLLVSALSLGQVFVQEISAVANSATSVSATYATAETAGNLNVVVIGWNDSHRPADE